MDKQLKCVTCGGVMVAPLGHESRKKYCSKKCCDKYLRAQNKTHRLGYMQAWRKSAVGYSSRFLERAKVATPNTDLTLQHLTDLVEVGKCAVSGVPFRFVNDFDAYHNPYAPSIDRVNSKRGYFKDNVQIVLSCINRMKNDMPNSDFLALWKALTT